MFQASHRARLAFSNDGAVPRDVVMFDVEENIQQMIDLALRERGAVFVATPGNAQNNRPAP